MNEIRRPKGSRKWHLQEASRHLQEIVRLARKQGPQFIADDGEEGVVVISESEYRHLLHPRTGKELVEAMARFPVKEIDLENEPVKGPVRDVEL